MNCKSGRASLETRWRCLIPSGPQMNSRSSCPTTQVEAKLPIAIPGFASYGGVGLVDAEFDAPPGAIVVVSCQSCGKWSAAARSNCRSPDHRLFRAIGLYRTFRPPRSRPPLIRARCSGKFISISSSRLMIDPASSNTAGICVSLSTTS